MKCLDEPVEKLLVFRLSGEGPNTVEAKAEVLQQLARLLADSIFTTNTVRALGLQEGRQERDLKDDFKYEAKPSIPWIACMEANQYMLYGI